MINGQTVGLVIPCHNEAMGLRSLLPHVPPEIDDVLVIDNNSTDATREVAQNLGARVIFEAQPGYGLAYQAGFKHLVTDIVVTLDGDGQYPVQEVPRLVRVFQHKKLDFLSASRFPLQQKMMLTRRVGNVLLTATANVLLGQKIADTQSGMWVFRRDLLHHVQPREAGMAFSEEFKMKVILSNRLFAEEHIPYYDRIGTSKLLPLKDGWKNLLYIFRLWYRHTF